MYTSKNNNQDEKRKFTYLKSLYTKIHKIKNKTKMIKQCKKKLNTFLFPIARPPLIRL